MVRDAGAQFGLGCGGASVADMLFAQAEPAPVTLADRLTLPRKPVAATIAGRKVQVQTGASRLQDGLLAVPFRIGSAGCRVHLSHSLIEWLVQPLGLQGAFWDEEPLQRALLLELASLDFLPALEIHTGEDIRLGESGVGEASHALDMALEADGVMLPLRIELTKRYAEMIVDFLDHLQPPEPMDFSGAMIDLVVEAGSQDLSIEELKDLRPGDVVMLDNHQPIAVLNGKLVAPVHRQADGVELDGPFYPRSHRAMPGTLADIQAGKDPTHLVHLTVETARVKTTVGAMDALKPRQALPLSCFDETGVDLVVSDRRFGRGEFAVIGTGLGVRIVSLMPAAADSQIS